MSDKAKKKFRSKWFRVAVEGATTDGRKIERNWLTQIANTYDPQKYGARIFLEHIRGLNPEWGFRCMGDVLAVKTETVKIDGKDALALFAQIQPTDEMVALNKAGQKVYSSIEVDPDFAGKGEAYLIGLGVTDSPASLGTDMLMFAAQHPDASPLKARKQSPHNLFSEAIECAIELEEIEDKPSVIDAFFSRLDALLKPKPADPAPTAPPIAGNDFTKIGEAVTAVAELVRGQDRQFSAITAELKSQLQKLGNDFATLRSQLEGTAHHSQPQRPAATGARTTALTDC